jgi:hypothetical protein
MRNDEDEDVVSKAPNTPHERDEVKAENVKEHGQKHLIPERLARSNGEKGFELRELR